MPRRYAALLVAIVVAVAVGGFPPIESPLSGPRAASAAVFDPEGFTLDNGLQVVVISNHRAPIVQHMVWYKVGAADEPPGKSGIAHFLEHLMFKGTDKLAPGEFSQIIARNGGQENAFTSWDYTAYYQTVAKDRLEIIMKHEADRMANLRLTDEVVDPERDVILEERRSRIDNEPSAQLREMVNASLYLNHPYRIPIIGWEHEMRGLTTEDAIEFYERWYAPNNAILIVAGDVTLDEVRPLAEKYYGAVAPRAVPERQRIEEPAQFAPRRVTLSNERVRQPALSITYLAPSHNRGASEHVYPLQVLNEIMGSGTTSRLYRALVVEQGIAAAAGSSYDSNSLDLGSFTFYVSPRPGLEMDLAETALLAEIERLRQDGVSAEEVAAAKQRMVAAAVYARDSLSGAPNIIGRALASGRTIEDIESWPERIEAVTAEQVNAALRAALLDEQSVTGVLLPKPTS
ncbi:MAG: M16 family metallopeptidase [Kiloniellales bacterium]